MGGTKPYGFLYSAAQTSHTAGTYNEQLIQEAIVNLSRNKTLIVIAHHLSAIKGADQIIVMDGGRIAAVGKHEELIEHCPLYAG